MSYQSTVLADEPVLLWRCSDESGPAVTDASGNAATGTAQGGVTFAAAGLLRADGSRALALDGSSTNPGVSAGPYQAAVLADAPLAYWPLGETGGAGSAAADASGNGYDGTYPSDGSVTAGAATIGGTPAAQFNDTSAPDPTTIYAGQGTGVTIDNPSGLPTQPTSGSVDYWIRPRLPAAVAEGGGVAHGFSSSYMMPLWWGTSDGSEPYLAAEVRLLNPASPDYGGSGALVNPTVYAAVSGSVAPLGDGPRFSDAAWTDETWHHIALTWDADTLTGHIYRDGAPWTSAGTAFEAFTAQTGAVTYGAIGAGPPGPDGWFECVTGALAHVALYDHALSAERVAAHYGAPVGAPTMVAQDATSTLPAAASIEVWLQSTTTQGGVLAQFVTADGTTADLTLYLRSDGVPAFRAGDTEIVRSSDRTVADGRIHHLVATLDADAAAWLYVDGSVAAHVEGVTPASPFTGRWQIGAGTTDDLAVPPLSPAYAGTIDEVCIYQD